MLVDIDELELYGRRQSVAIAACVCVECGKTVAPRDQVNACYKAMGLCIVCNEAIIYRNRQEMLYG